jgi:hypothetical protein
MLRILSAPIKYFFKLAQVISLGIDSRYAFDPFSKIGLKPFRDAGYADCTYKCTVKML